MKLSRRNFLKGTALGGAGLLIKNPARAKLFSQRPNFIFILSDDHRWDYLSCAGHPFLKTSALDRLAKEGVRFTNAFVTTSLCSPSRASFLTGQYVHNHRITRNGSLVGRLPRTFLELLHSAGYQTAFVGKWHIGGFKVPQPKGVDYLVTFISQGLYYNCPLIVQGKQVKTKKYITEELTDYALRFLETRDRQKPFFLYLSHKAVHAPFQPPDELKDLFKTQEIYLPAEAEEKGLKPYFDYMHLTAVGKKQDLKDTIRGYCSAIYKLDQEIGRLLKALDQLDLAENTVVIYTSDNGFLWGEHRLFDKRWAYEESIRIPFLVRAPGIVKNPGREIDELVLNIDLAPTVLELAGISFPKSIQGKSFAPLLGEKSPGWREDFLYEYFYDEYYNVPPMLAVRTREWKYIRYRYHLRAEELYYLKEDPGEQNNLADAPEYQEQKQRLSQRLEQLLKETGFKN